MEPFSPARSFGADGEVDGEVCFNTSMTGYQEILTDPELPRPDRHDDLSADRQLRRQRRGRGEPAAAAGRLRRPRAQPRAEQLPLPSRVSSDTCKHWGIVGIEAIDTRALVRRLRIRGAMKGVLSTVDLDDASLVAKAQASPGLVGRDLVREVLPDRAAASGRAAEPLDASERQASSESAAASGQTRPHVVALDFGMKWNIARHLFDMGCRVTILPGTATADEVLAQEPDGVFLSNGPGDPEPLDYAIEHDPRPAGQEADLRHLPGPPTALAWPAGRRPSSSSSATAGRTSRCMNHGNRRGGDHLAEPRLRRRRGLAARRPGSHPPQPQRRHDRGRRGTATCRPSACSTTPKPRPARTTATICSDRFLESM